MASDFEAAEIVQAAFYRGFGSLLAVAAALFGVAWVFSGSLGWLTVVTAMAAVGCRLVATLWEPDAGRPEPTDSDDYGRLP